MEAFKVISAGAAVVACLLVQLSTAMDYSDTYIVNHNSKISDGSKFGVETMGYKKARDMVECLMSCEITPSQALVLWDETSKDCQCATRINILEKVDIVSGGGKDLLVRKPYFNGKILYCNGRFL